MEDPRALPVELTTICMVTDGKRVLMQNRTGEDWPGLVFPGGHVECRESIVEGVIREVKEETGITIENPKLCGVQDWEYGKEGRYVVFLFKADKFHGDLSSSDEGEAMWVPIDDVLNRDLAENFDRIYKVFVDDNISEMFHPEKDGWDCKYF